MDITWLDIWKFHGAALLAGCVDHRRPHMASPSGAPYGNHDCRDGITAQKMDRGDGKERAVPGRGHPRCIHVYHMVVCSMGNRSRGRASMAVRGLGGSSSGRGVPVQSHAGS